MRSRYLLPIVTLYPAFVVFGCSRKPSTDTDANNANTQNSSDSSGTRPAERQEAPREPLVVPARTMVTVRLGSALGSKLSQSGQTFTGTVARDVRVGDVVVIPRGTPVTGP